MKFNGCRNTPLDRPLAWLLGNKIRSGHGWSEQRFRSFEFRSSADIALVHAVHEMLWTSASAGFDEETITSSLIGHLTSQFGWWTIMSGLTQNKPIPTTIRSFQWAQQQRHLEWKNGADFGLVLHVGGRLRLAIFQAKKSFGQPLVKVDIFRGPQPVKQTTDRYAEHQRMTVEDRNILACANKNLEHLILHDKIIGMATRHDHQIFQMASHIAHRTEVLLGEINGHPWWGHYVFWHSEADTGATCKLQAPTMADLGTLTAGIKRKVLPERQGWKQFGFEYSDFKLDAPSEDFIEFVANGLTFSDGTQGYIEVPPEKLKEVLGIAKFADGLPPLLLLEHDTRQPSIWRNLFAGTSYSLQGNASDEPIPDLGLSPTKRPPPQPSAPDKTIGWTR